ncbi:DUF3575 domain-containing protein [Pontibacter sp. JH31]|uniref:DUF3575 domain-containing protein n=1 Tax=Pontibacter aquaedesilientis TaxID=2766980 RepID=A0ABR7XGP3_9BACT|nr:DUF3575 domain-containing protein [Pontibacter aquaedesilientis]MBD1397469.1 DUF3575 domain-containing protein [Pontibacter aquaedesilientis]
MKIKLLFAVAAAAFLTFPLQDAKAQAQQPKRAVIKVNPLSAFALTGSGFLEYAVTDNISAQLGAFTTGASISNVKFKGYGFTPEVRYYFSENKAAPMGPYLAGYGRIQNFKLTVEKQDENGRDYSATYAPIGGGVAIGNQWIFNSGFALDVFLGAGYNGGNLKVNVGTEEDFDAGIIGDMILGGGFGFRPGITLGYNF